MTVARVARHGAKPPALWTTDLEHQKGRAMNEWKNVEIEKDGTTYVGKYRVEGGIITVTYDWQGGGDKSSRVGSSDADQLAKLLLLELITEMQTKTDRR